MTIETSPDENIPQMEIPKTKIEPDNDLMMHKQLEQQYAEANKRIMDLRQQEQLIDDMITNATVEAAEIRGALRLLTQQMSRKKD